MSENIFIGAEISFPALRDFIFTTKLNQGDTIALHPMNYEQILDEIRHHHEGSIEIPINILGILLVKDANDTVEIGKINIIKNDDLLH
jgi:hypothetical protein